MSVDLDLGDFAGLVEECEGDLVAIVPLRKVVREIAPSHVLPSVGERHFGAFGHLFRNAGLLRIKPVAAFGGKLLDQCECISEPGLGFRTDAEVHHVHLGHFTVIVFTLAHIFRMTLAVSPGVIPVTVLADNPAAFHYYRTFVHP